MEQHDTVNQLVSKMTLAEKVSLLSGADKWRTKAIPRVGLAAVTVSDGPHGLRKEVADPEKGLLYGPLNLFSDSMRHRLFV